MKRIILLLTTFVLFTLMGFAQSSANYSFSTSVAGSMALDMNGNPIDMTSGTNTLITGMQDNVRSGFIDIGFDFYFMYGINATYNKYTKFDLSSNG
ncbi:MAG TPA: hypothetical protein DCQ31_13040, partial [Bacteroidales bacterium]|nr:hypothetical protein [Bacteroidales bacterium]